MRWIVTLPADLLRAVVVLVAFGSAVASLTAWASYFVPALVFLSEPAIPALAAAALAGLLWLALPAPRRPASAGPLALVAVVLWSAMLAPEAAGRLVQKRGPAGADTLKVVQFNLWQDDWTHTSEKTAWLRKEDPDVILMQEVSGGSIWLLANLAPAYPYRTGCEYVRYTCSLMILSKRKPTQIGQSLGEQPGSGWAWARFSSPGGDYAVATIHAPWPLLDGAQQKTLARLGEDVKRLKSDAVILTGDFNATPWSAPLRSFDRDSGLSRNTRMTPTWPSPALGHGRLPSPVPLLPIDHIYTGPAWRVVSLSRGPDLGSDHYPLVAVLTRDKPAGKPPELKTERAPPGKP
jgi:endonuclease/exonuclease/phosphatase (EEP) superfamily protein YafD